MESYSLKNGIEIKKAAEHELVRILKLDLLKMHDVEDCNFPKAVFRDLKLDIAADDGVYTIYMEYKKKDCPKLSVV